MQIICVSRGTLSGGDEFAERLAKKLGYACLSREELIEAAIKEGIQVGKLEMAMIKPWIFSEQLDLQREHYLAFTTAYLCDRAMEGGLVYHGRTGHLLLPGVDHVLSVRVVSDQEQRISRVMKQLGLDREKARQYIREVDADRRQWARAMYGVGWEDSAQYDITVNLEHMNVDNAASALTAVAQLPDFQMTPASRKAMEDLRLAAKCRVALSTHEQTYRAKFKVQADAGVVTVAFQPQDARCAESIAQVLAPVEGVRQVHSTMATTNILWVQQRFDPASDTFHEVVELATNWNAAVQLIRLEPPDEGQDASAAEAPQPTVQSVEAHESGQYNGGIEEDSEDDEPDDGGVKSTLNELAMAGRAGGGGVVRGEASALLESLDRSRSYSLVVIGDLFLEKGHAARVRMTRELQRFVGEHIAAPVVGADELKAQYLFSRRDVGRLAGYLAVVGALYLVVFSNQEVILRFLSGQWGGTGPLARIVVAVTVFLFVPVVAQTYGTVAKSLMKLIKME